MAGKQNRKLGPRTTVVFRTGQGRGAGARTQYIYPLKSVANKLGMEAAKNPTTEVKRGGKTTKVRVRGSFGAKHIKVPVGGGGGSNTAAGRRGVNTQKFVSVPVPADATIDSITKFLEKLKNKPKFFVSPDGRTYPIEANNR